MAQYSKKRRQSAQKSSRATCFSRVRSYLLQEAETCFASAAEIQFARSGFGFVMGTVAQNCWIATALSDASPEDPFVAAAVQTSAAHVAKYARPDGWTYYNNSAEIPPDTDDLALAMSLLSAARWPERDALLAGPLGLLRANTETAGAFRTWLCQNGQATSLDVRWASEKSPVQPDVVANIAWALLSGGHLDWEADIRAAIRWLSADPVARLRDNHWYYGDGYLGFIMMRLFADCPSNWPEKDAAIAAAETLADDLRSGQSSDGSWPQRKSPLARKTLGRDEYQGTDRSSLETAWRVAALREIDGDDTDILDSAIRFLTENQMLDGAYASEPFFETLSLEPYGSRGITSAAALRALTKNQRRKPSLDIWGLEFGNTVRR